MERREASPALFENWKKGPVFRKKGLDCVHLWIKFSIQNVFLRVSRRKTAKYFPAGPLIFGVF